MTEGNKWADNLRERLQNIRQLSEEADISRKQRLRIKNKIQDIESSLVKVEKNASSQKDGSMTERQKQLLQECEDMIQTVVTSIQNTQERER
jgi:hypothetical protein